MSKRVKVVLDTDIGDDIDDAYALVFAALHPAIDLRAVTTVHGSPQLKARIADKLLRLLGHPQIPIAAGAGAEKGTECQGPFVTESDPEHSRTYAGVTDVWRKAFSAGDVSLVTIGPVTNVGRYVDGGAEARPARIAAMAGEQQTAMAEYNVKCDPAAFAKMLAWGAPIFQGPFNPTRRVVLSADDVEVLRTSGQAHNQALAELTDLWWPHRGAKPGPVLYDVCPLMWLFAPERFKTHGAHLEVETQQAGALGCTRETAGTTNVEVCDDLDAEAIRKMVLETLLSGKGRS